MRFRSSVNNQSTREQESVMKLIRVGVDLAKNVFQVHGVGRDARNVWRGMSTAPAARQVSAWWGIHQILRPPFRFSTLPHFSFTFVAHSSLVLMSCGNSLIHSQGLHASMTPRELK
jgi:hypothetical protein